MFKKPLENFSPSRVLCWLTSIFSFLLVVGVLTACHYVAQHIHYLEFENELYSKVHFDKNTEDMNEKPILSHYLPLNNQTVRLSLVLADHLKNGEFERASKLSHTSNLSEVTSFKALDDHINEITNLRKLLTEKQGQLKGLGPSFDDLSKRFLALQKQFASALDVALSPIEKPIPAFYASGTFKDLPVIEGIPDNLGTDSAILNVLNNLVTTQSGTRNDRKSLNLDHSELARLRKEVEIFRERDANIQQKKGALESELKEFAQELSIKEAEALDLVFNQLRSLSQRNIDPNSEFIYQQLQKLGLQLV